MITSTQWSGATPSSVHSSSCAPPAVSEEEVLAVIKAWRATAEGHGVDAVEVGRMVECLGPRLKHCTGGVRAAASALHDVFDTEKVCCGVACGGTSLHGVVDLDQCGREGAGQSGAP